MKYLGSKNRLAKEIVPIIQSYIDSTGYDTYCEPFAGGCNIIDKISAARKCANDIHPELIAMWKALQRGWIPPIHISEDEYINVRDNKEQYPQFYVGYVGFNSTYSAKYFGGYARGFKADGITPRDESNEAFRNLMKQVPNIMDVEFSCGSYNSINLNNSVIYCDPPYENTTQYSPQKLNYPEFWEWCRQMSKTNVVLISSYEAPDDFECIWSKTYLANFDVNRGNDKDKKVRVEKLFKYKNVSSDNKFNLYNSDCLDVIGQIANSSIDLIVTDPPYKLTSRGSSGTMGGYWKSEKAKKGTVFNHNSISCKQYLPEFYRILKDKSILYLMCNNTNLQEMINVGVESGFKFVKALIWEKGNKICGRYYMNCFEYILLFRKGGDRPINHCGTPDILKIPIKKLKDRDGKNLHDTEKPVELMSLLIENSSNKNDLILDPFMGIGATGVACKITDRKFIGIELDTNYYNIAKNRIEEAYAK